MPRPLAGRLKHSALLPEVGGGAAAPGSAAGRPYVDGEVSFGVSPCNCWEKWLRRSARLGLNRMGLVQGGRGLGSRFSDRSRALPKRRPAGAVPRLLAALRRPRRPGAGQLR